MLPGVAVIVLLAHPTSMMATSPPSQQVKDEAHRQAGSEVMSDADMALLRERLFVVFSEEANLVIDLYVKAQQAFYSTHPQQALRYIDRALAIRENADLKAFEGAIYFGMGQQAEARASFEKALAADPDVPIPMVEGLHDWLKRNRLID